MDQLETQFTDLRSFLPTVPVDPVSYTADSCTRGDGMLSVPRRPEPHSAHGDNSAPHGGYYAHMPAAVNPESPSAQGKRKTAVTGAGEQRSKRNRYVSIACNECKRRKIKCNGDKPCQRCGSLELECLYAPNCCPNNNQDGEETRRLAERLEQLQAQVTSLASELGELRQETKKLAPLKDRVLPPLPSPSAFPPSPKVSYGSQRNHDYLPASFTRSTPSFRGPTSMAFNVGIAKNTLRGMGYLEDQPRPQSPADDAALSQAISSPRSAAVSATGRSVTKDPLFEYSRDEMIRLCRLHQEEIGLMYPVVNINDVIDHAQQLANWMEDVRRASGTFSEASGMDLEDIQTLEVKIIMCSALVVEGHGYSTKATILWESMETKTNNLLMNEASNVKNIPFLALVGGYRFLSNEEVTAWRIMGQVARRCLEMGLHRRAVIEKIRNERDKRNAIITFWTAYVLDRRWSVGTGLPFVVHDAQIDPALPYPADHSFLCAMITHSKLAARIWKLVDYFDPVVIRDLKHEDVEQLDQEILRSYEEVPHHIRIKTFSEHMPVPGTATYDIERLQMWTKLRLNQIRIWLHTPVLHSANSINKNPLLASRAVELSKETIRYLARLNSTTEIYRRLQTYYHQYLTSAIAVLFLASTHARRFVSECRAEFKLAMELIKGLSEKGWVSQRLWHTIKCIKVCAPRLGLIQQNGVKDSQDDTKSFTPHNHRAEIHPMGVTSGVNTPESRPTDASVHNSSSYTTSTLPMYIEMQTPIEGLGDPDNGLRLQSEMSKIFDDLTSTTAFSQPMAYSGSGRNNSLDIPSHFDPNAFDYYSQMGNPSSPSGLVLTDDEIYQQFRQMF